jgi:hypothetical protein
MRSALFLASALAVAALASCTMLLGDDFEIVPGGGGTGGMGAGAMGGNSGGGSVGGDGGGSTGDGPQLIGSSPATDTTNASVSPFGLLFFDRAVDVGQATGKISMSDGASSDVAQVETCPDASPSCVRFVAPASLATDALLRGATTYTVTIDKSFQDPDGNTNDVDSSVSFTTFAYDPIFYEPTSVDGDVAGIAYVPAVNALYIAGTGTLNFNGPDVERVVLDAATFSPVTSSVVAQPNFFAIGNCTGGSSREGHQLDYWVDTLYLSASRCDAVYTMPVDQGTGALPSSSQGTISGTSITAVPNDAIYRAEGTVVFDLGPGVGNSGFFGQGTLGTGPLSTGILLRRPLAIQFWVVWKDRAGFIDNDPFYLGGGPDNTGALNIFVAAGDTIHKVRRLDAMETNAHTIDGVSYESPQLRVDSLGRLYLGDETHLVVYDTTGFNGFTELAVREGVDFRRFDIREEGTATHVYFTDFEGLGTIRHVAIDF